MSKPNTSWDLRSLDVLRGLLCMEVLLGHARSQLWMPWHEWIQQPHSLPAKVLAVSSGALSFGKEAVLVFFVLSGFFIHLREAQAAAQGKKDDFNWREYLRRRARRILPPLYAAMALTVMLDALGRHFFPPYYHSQTGHELIDANILHSGYQLSAVIPALLAQPSLLGIHFGSNGALWSVGTEVFYYLLYPAFVWVWRRQPVTAYAIGISGSLLPTLLGIGFVYSAAISCYSFWLAGALIADLMMRTKAPAGSYRWFALLCLVASSTALLGKAHFFEQHALLQQLAHLVSACCAVFAFLNLPWPSNQQPLFRFGEWLGTRSYSLYVFHSPVLSILSAATFTLAGCLPHHGWLALGGAFAATGVGMLGFQWVEAHFLPTRIKLA